MGRVLPRPQLVTIKGVVDALLGRSLDDLVLQDLPVPLSREYDGFECAIWDATAKSLGVPIHRLLGGAVRDRVKVGAWSSFREPGEMGAARPEIPDEGYDCIKLKAGLDDDVAGWCREIKAEAPGMWVIIDPNQRWENAGEARRRLRELDAIGNLLLIEDPIPRWMLQDYARLRTFTATPVVLHVALPYVYLGQRPYEAISALAHGAVDGFNFNCGLAEIPRARRDSSRRQPALLARLRGRPRHPRGDVRPLRRGGEELHLALGHLRANDPLARSARDAAASSSRPTSACRRHRASASRLRLTRSPGHKTGETVYAL